MAYEGSRFFSCTTQGWTWNWIDTAFVVLNIVGVSFELQVERARRQNTGQSILENVLFGRVIRIFKIFRVARVFRLLRLLQFPSNVNDAVSAVLCSLKSVWSSVVLLVVLFYICGICFLSMATDLRI